MIQPSDGLYRNVKENSFSIRGEEFLHLLSTCQPLASQERLCSTVDCALTFVTELSATLSSLENIPFGHFIAQVIVS